LLMPSWETASDADPACLSFRIPTSGINFDDQCNS
jgi:hypothetical protein